MTPALRRATVLLVLWFLLGQHRSSLADEKKSQSADPFAPHPQGVSDTAKPPPEPDHLQPMPAYEQNGYDQAVFRSLLGPGNTKLWMVEKRSFAAEQAVILLHEKETSADPFEQVLLSEKWFIEHAAARRQIWRWKDLGEDRGLQLDIEDTKDVQRSRVEVTAGFAQSVRRAWSAVLRRTRYSDTGTGGLDGTTFQFCDEFDRCGETWSPSTGFPALLASLGQKLGRLARAEEAARAALIRECLQLADEIVARAEDNKAR